MGRRSWDELDAILDEALDLDPHKRPILFDTNNVKEFRRIRGLSVQDWTR